MKRCLVAMVLLAFLLAGCGNVTLKGEALTAAEQSTMDAYQAALRWESETTTRPSTRPAKGAYLVENFKQWRDFVRSARKDLNWGPKLEGE